MDRETRSAQFLFDHGFSISVTGENRWRRRVVSQFEVIPRILTNQQIALLLTTRSNRFRAKVRRHVRASVRELREPVQILKDRQMPKKWTLAFFALLVLLALVAPGDVGWYRNPFSRVDGVFERACRTMPTVHSYLWPPSW